MNSDFNYYTTVLLHNSFMESTFKLILTWEILIHADFDPMGYGYNTVIEKYATIGSVESRSLPPDLRFSISVTRVSCIFWSIFVQNRKNLSFFCTVALPLHFW